MSNMICEHPFVMQVLCIGTFNFLLCFFFYHIILFVFGIPLFVDSNEHTHGKWNLWVVHKLLLTAVYGFIMFMYHSGWKETLPGEPIDGTITWCFNLFSNCLISFSFMQQKLPFTSMLLSCSFLMRLRHLLVALLVPMLRLLSG